MITIGTTPILLTIISKLDLNPLIHKLKSLDIFDEQQKEPSGEQMAVLFAELFTAVAPQLGKIADDIPLFVSAYKEISLDEAKKIDLAEFINEVKNDEGIKSFFTTALRQKAEPDA